jgi:hypothetical protein
MPCLSQHRHWLLVSPWETLTCHIPTSPIRGHFSYHALITKITKSPVPQHFHPKAAPAKLGPCLFLFLLPARSF